MVSILIITVLATVEPQNEVSESDENTAVSSMIQMVQYGTLGNSHFQTGSLLIFCDIFWFLINLDCNKFLCPLKVISKAVAKVT